MSHGRPRPITTGPSAWCSPGGHFVPRRHLANRNTCRACANKAHTQPTTGATR